MLTDASGEILWRVGSPEVLRRTDRLEFDEGADWSEAEDKQVEGVIELLGNGSAFVRLSEGETSDDDVYVSAAQVKRCELVSGDKVAGQMRPPRRSERFPSLIRGQSRSCRRW